MDYTPEQLQSALAKAQAAGDQAAVSAIQAHLGTASSYAPQELQSAFWKASAANDEPAKQAIFQHMKAQGIPLGAPAAGSIAPQADAATGMGADERLAAGMGKSLHDTGMGLRQLGAAIADKVSPRQQTVAGLVSGADNSRSASMQREVTASQKQDAALMNTGVGYAGDIVGQVGQLAVPAGDAAKALSWAGRAAPYIGAAVRAGSFAGTQPVEQGQTRLGNVATTAAFGAGGKVLANGFGALASRAQPVVDEVKQGAINNLRSLGVPLHLAQVSESPFLKNLSSAINKTLPFTGATKAGAAQQGAFNKAASNLIGENTPKLTDDVLAKVAQRQSAAYDALFARNKITIDPQAVAGLNHVIAQASVDPQIGTVVKNAVMRYINAADANGEIPGTAYQLLRNSLQPLEKAQGYGFLLGDVRKVMQDTANRSFTGGDAKALAQLNAEYANRKVIEKSLTRTGESNGAAGNVNPTTLWSLVNGKYGSTKDMRELARAGQLVLKDGVPNSGTSGREQMMRLLGLGPAGPAALVGLAPLALKMAAGGAGLGRILNSNLASRALPNAGGKALNKLALLAQIAPYLVPATAGAASQRNAPKKNAPQPPVR